MKSLNGIAVKRRNLCTGAYVLSTRAGKFTL